MRGGTVRPPERFAKPILPGSLRREAGVDRGGRCGGKGWYKRGMAPRQHDPWPDTPPTAGAAGRSENGIFVGAGGNAGAWRLLDASANRAGEALRVVEDVLRFMLDDPHLTALTKALRHDLTALLASDEVPLRVMLRDVVGDVGPTVPAVNSLPRTTVSDLLAANAARGEQALRSLQECALVLQPGLASGFERLRYRLYDIERAALVAAQALKRMHGKTLCVLVDGSDNQAAFVRLVESLFECGARMVQLRDKSLPVPALVERARAALQIARRRRPDGDAVVLINDRADVAAAVGADGVHTGALDLPANLCRRVMGPRCIVGRTAHDMAQAQAAVLDGADYLGVGPCFPSSTKSFASHAPEAFLADVARNVSLPVFAIGGVTLERLDILAPLGIRRVAVAAAITSAADPARMAAAFIERLGQIAGPAGGSA